MADASPTPGPATPSRPYPYHLAVRATLRDTDGVGHVNNAVYLTWTEEVRTSYVIERRGLTLTDLSRLDFIMASAQLDFRSPVLLHELVDLWCGPSRIGTKSWDLVYEARARKDGRVVLEARTVQVSYDYGAGKTIPIAADWRKMLEEDFLR